MQLLVESKPRDTAHSAAQRYAGRPRVDRIIDVVAGVFLQQPETIRARHGGSERKVVAWLGCYEGMNRLGAIATALRLRSTSRVSAMIADCDRELRDNANLRTTIDRCLELLRPTMAPPATSHRLPSLASG